MQKQVPPKIKSPKKPGATPLEKKNTSQTVTANNSDDNEDVQLIERTHGVPEETTSSLLVKAIERSKQAIEGAESVLEDDEVKINLVRS